MRNVIIKIFKFCIYCLLILLTIINLDKYLLNNQIIKKTLENTLTNGQNIKFSIEKVYPQYLKLKLTLHNINIINKEQKVLNIHRAEINSTLKNFILKHTINIEKLNIFSPDNKVYNTNCTIYDNHNIIRGYHKGSIRNIDNKVCYFKFFQKSLQIETKEMSIGQITFKGNLSFSFTKKNNIFSTKGEIDFNNMELKDILPIINNSYVTNLNLNASLKKCYLNIVQKQINTTSYNQDIAKPDIIIKFNNLRIDNIKNFNEGEFHLNLYKDNYHINIYNNLKENPLLIKFNKKSKDIIVSGGINDTTKKLLIKHLQLKSNIIEKILSQIQYSQETKQTFSLKSNLNKLSNINFDSNITNFLIKKHNLRIDFINLTLDIKGQQITTHLNAKNKNFSIDIHNETKVNNENAIHNLQSKININPNTTSELEIGKRNIITLNAQGKTTFKTNNTFFNSTVNLNSSNFNILTLGFIKKDGNKLQLELDGNFNDQAIYNITFHGKGDNNVNLNGTIKNNRFIIKDFYFDDNFLPKIDFNLNEKINKIKVSIDQIKVSKKQIKSLIKNNYFNTKKLKISLKAKKITLLNNNTLDDITLNSFFNGYKYTSATFNAKINNDLPIVLEIKNNDDKYQEIWNMSYKRLDIALSALGIKDILKRGNLDLKLIIDRSICSMLNPIPKIDITLNSGPFTLLQSPFLLNLTSLNIMSIFNKNNPSVFDNLHISLTINPDNIKINKSLADGFCGTLVFSSGKIKENKIKTKGYFLPSWYGINNILKIFTLNKKDDIKKKMYGFFLPIPFSKTFSFYY